MCVCVCVCGCECVWVCVWVMCVCVVDIACSDVRVITGSSLLLIYLTHTQMNHEIS